MNQDLTQHREDQSRQFLRALLDPLNASPQWLIGCVKALGEGIRPKIPEAFALTAEQRTTVAEMSSRLARHLAPASPADIGAVLALLQCAFPSAPMDPMAAKANVRGYALALEGVPAFALDEAARRILKGEAGLKHAFLPTPPQLRDVANEASRPARWHAVQLRRLLEAEVEPETSPEARERVRAMVADLAASLPPPRDRRRGNPPGVDHSQK